MKLLRYRVTNFRSVKDSGWIDCDKVTTLVGINESGKSNLLLALWKLNPARYGEIDILHDMPVSMLSELRGKKNELAFINAVFNCDEESANGISQKLNCICKKDIEITVTRFYDGHYSVSFQNGNPDSVVVKDTEDMIIENTNDDSSDNDTNNIKIYTEEELIQTVVNEIPKFVYYSNYGLWKLWKFIFQNIFTACNKVA